jgi:TonB family protein
MALARARTRMPAAYRQSLLGKPDPRLARCLAISSGLGAIVLFGILVTPARREEMRMDEMPRRLARLILEEPTKPAVLPPQLDVRPERAPESDLAEVERLSSAPSQPAPSAEAADPGEASSGGVGQRRLAAVRRVDAGTAGREQARREVQESLTQTRHEVKETLAEVTAVLSAVKSGSSTNSAPRRGRPGGGRARGELEQVDAVKAAGPGTAGDEPITAGLLDIGSITDVRADLASADPSIAGGGGGVGGRRGGRGSAAGSGSGGDEGSGGSVESGAYRSNASLLAVVRRYAPGIQYCYDNELKRDLTLNGKMVLVVTVLASGVVSEVGITHDSLGSTRLQECVLAQVREWRFPAIQEGTVSFQAPFVFTPPES